MNYCFLDLETTGFDPEKDSIIEVSFICVDSDKVIDKFDQVFIPDKSSISDFISNLTGITNKEVLESGKYLKESLEDIKNKIGERIIIGHNIDFDINFLIKNGIDLKNNKRIDTHELSRILLPQEESFALEVLSQKYKFNHNNAHRAMSDVLASWELFKFLTQKIENLPKKYLTSINDFLKNKTDWYAKFLFLDSKGTDNKNEDIKISQPEIKEQIIPKNFNEVYLKNNKNCFLKIGNNDVSINLYKNIAKKYYKKSNEKFLIITNKINFFTEIEKFLTPDVILDIDRLLLFKENRNKLNNSDTTFYLKCCYRYFLGFESVDRFDLFFKERDLWNEVNIKNNDNIIFKDIIHKKEKEFCLIITPKDFFRFNELTLIKDRVLIIDEVEEFAENLLYAPIKTYSFKKFLNNNDSEITNKAQFFITRCCQDLIEPKLEHKINKFPQKVLLNQNEKFKDIADEINEFEESELNDFVVANLKNPKDKIIRFIEYFPDSGNLSFNFWHPDDWRHFKNILSKFKKIICHRTTIIGESLPFFRIFLGITEGAQIKLLESFSKKELIIPNDLISHNSPDYNNFCVNKILNIFKNDLSNLAVNFSSLETLRKSYDEVNTKNIDKSLNFIAGEKVLGGDGKLIQLLKKNASKRILFLFKKFMYPDITEYNFKKIIIQKFAFNPPHPLLRKIELVLKQSGQSFFDIWVITQVAANLSRSVANYPKTQKIIFLDPRENTKWGKDIIKRGLSDFLQ